MAVKKSIDSISKTSPDATVPVVQAVPAEKPVTPPQTLSTTPTPTSTPEPISGAPAPLEPATHDLSHEEQGESFETLFPEPSVVMEGPPSWVWWLVLFVASSVVAVVGYQLVSTRLAVWAQKSGMVSSPTPSTAAVASATPVVSTTPEATATVTTSTPVPATSATPAASSSFTLRVLNGTKITGAASKAQAALEQAGLTVRTVGNARNQTYTETTVYYVAGKQAEAQVAADALVGYNPTLQQSDSLAQPDDVLVVVAQ